MVGTNLPVDRLFGPASELIDTFEALAAELSGSEKVALFQRNVERAYRI